MTYHTQSWAFWSLHTNWTYELIPNFHNNSTINSTENSKTLPRILRNSRTHQGMMVDGLALEIKLNPEGVLQHWLDIIHYPLAFCDLSLYKIRVKKEVPELVRGLQHLHRLWRCPWEVSRKMLCGLQTRMPQEWKVRLGYPQPRTRASS